MFSRKSTRRVGAALSAVALAAMVAACSSSGSGGGGKSSDVIKVGVLSSNNPTFALVSSQTISAAKAAAANIKTPGGQKLEVVPIENDGTPADAVQTVSRAVREDNVHFITGFFTSAIAAALSKQASQLGVVVLDADSKDPSLTAANCSNNYFRIAMSSVTFTRGAISVGLTKNAKTWDIVAADDATGHGAAEEFARQAKAAGITIVKQVFTPNGASDYAPYISKLKASPADALLVPLSGEDGQTFAKQANSFGLFPSYKLILGESLLSASDLAEGSALKGVQEVLTWNPDSASAEAATFLKEFPPQNKGVAAWWLPADVYSTFEVIGQAVNTAGSTDSDKIIKALAGSTHNTLSGPIQIRAADHQSLRPLVLVQVSIVNGKPELKTVRQIPVGDVSPAADSACKL
ncbi:ABC transporter substrate-binding protein [Actinacidiphila sp. ITFR-21]|uniref:ABC transporter substrate-binding protein n=1 Tax=Actinacidiphila sp. ITFR-21 TaxID=3075199 RepID=UPI0028896112|nr:ABC transporter substrate-binding protein [Streptomyces sp. ITFR-21]WNI18751.1 ABC transporter substrate-binding protein [Streptomyces sp. ITFR-21]